MGFLENILKSSNKTVKDNWNTLKSLADLDMAHSASFNLPVLIFKHSVRCGISAHVLSRFKKDWDVGFDEVQPYFLDLLQYRDVSNAIESKYNVIHQSPQVLLIIDGQCIYNASHDEIMANDIKKKLAQQ